MIAEIEEFEKIIKQNKSIFFDKVWEKHNGDYKLIYNIQGYVTETDKLYPNLKIIFWLNNEKTALIENVITFLYKQNCNYKTETIKVDVKNTFNKILSYLDEEPSNLLLRELILDGAEIFNNVISKKKINDFAQTVNMEPIGNQSCISTLIDFTLIMNSGTYKFALKMVSSRWNLIYNESNVMANDIEDIAEKVLDYIYED